MPKAPFCPCTSCELDREQGKPLFVLRLQDDAGYYNPDHPYEGHYSSPRDLAMRFGPRHAEEALALFPEETPA